MQIQIQNFPRRKNYVEIDNELHFKFKMQK